LNPRGLAERRIEYIAAMHAFACSIWWCGRPLLVRPFNNRAHQHHAGGFLNLLLIHIPAKPP
jgi:hypothetical protein